MSNGIKTLSRRPAFRDSSTYSTSIQGREHSMGNCTGLQKKTKLIKIQLSDRVNKTDLYEGKRKT